MAKIQFGNDIVLSIGTGLNFLVVLVISWQALDFCFVVLRIIADSSLGLTLS